MKICGIELKSNYAILTILESTNEKRKSKFKKILYYNYKNLLGN